MIKYFTIENFLTNIECDNVTEYSIKNLKLRKALMTNDLLNEKVRKSKVAFTDFNGEFSFIKKRLNEEINKVMKLKGYKIEFEKEPFQFTTYETGEFYNWHKDASERALSERYCSIVIQLNDEYHGGDLEMVIPKSDSKEILKFKKGKGNLFVFLSSITHRVAEVTDGTRYSLVSWFSIKPINNFKKTLI